MNLGHFGKMASLLGLGQAARLYGSRALGVPSVRLRIPGIKTLVQCRPRDSDRCALSQIFLERDCDIDLKFQPEFIIDGGANVGYASLYFANKFPQARIIAVEPDQTNYELARENCAQYPNIEVLKGAIWHTHTSLAIENEGDLSWAFKVREGDSAEPNAVQAYTISDLMGKAGAETMGLLKLDIEGAEEAIFSHADDGWIDKTKVLVIEVHGDQAYQAVSNAMKQRDFAQSKQGEKLVFVNNAYC